jgi:HlyD family type I secretion membrane fusion protein
MLDTLSGNTVYDPEADVERKLRSVSIAFAILLAVFVLAGMLVPIGGAVISSGRIGVESHVKRIAHPAGGVIAEILVRNGQAVRKGQILMRFDDRVTGADAQFSSLSVDQMLAQRARLEAERLGTSGIVFPAELSRGDPVATKAMADEEKLFRIRVAELSGMESQLNARIDQYNQQIIAKRAQIRALEKQSVLIEPERKGVRELWDQDLVTISRLNQLERTAADIEGSIGAMQADIAQTQARITEARQQIIQLGETRRSEAGTQLAQLNATLNQQQVRSVSAGDAQERSVVRAPHDGVVDKLAFNTIGGVVRPAEVIMEIVPETDTMLVEAAVAPNDIDRVRTGQTARIRFTAFSNTATPEIIGKVVFVAADSTLIPESQMSYYPARIAIDEADLGRYPELALKPGMPAEVFIETGDRMMISYLTKPLRDQFARAFRDD